MKGIEVSSEDIDLIAEKILYSGLIEPRTNIDLLKPNDKQEVIDIIRELQDFDIQVDVHDPWADPKEVKDEYDIDLVEAIDSTPYAGVIMAVAHNEFTQP